MTVPQCVSEQWSHSLCCVFLGSDMSVHAVEVDEGEAAAVLQEALDLRRRRQALDTREPQPDLKLVQPIACYTYAVYSFYNFSLQS